MENLNQLVHDTIAWYAADGLNLHSHLLCNPANDVFAVNMVDDSPKRRPSHVVVMARIEGDYVIIEADRTDKPLVDRLVDSGIPREKIIEYYAGEPLPEGLKQPADFSIS